MAKQQQFDPTALRAAVINLALVLGVSAEDLSVVQQPAPQGRARRSTPSTNAAPKGRRGGQAKAKGSRKAPNVQVFGAPKGFSLATASGLRKGQIFSLRETGAQYQVTTPKGSAVVKALHPSGEVYEFDGQKAVLLVSL